MNIYVLKTFTLKELYFGLADGDVQAAVQKHKGDELSPVGHWRWESEEVKWGEVGSELHEALAHSFISALRRQPPEEGWVIVFGGDN